MNIRLTQSAGASPKHSTKQYLHAGLGAMATVVMLVGTATWTAKHEASRATPVGAQTRAVASVQPPTQPVLPTVFYLVGSKEQAAALNAEVNRHVAYWNDVGLDAPKAVIGVVASPMEEQAFYHAAGEATAELLNVEVVDLRDR